MSDIRYVTEYVGLQPNPVQIASEESYERWLKYWDSFEWDHVVGLESIEMFIISACSSAFYMEE